MAGSCSFFAPDLQCTEVTEEIPMHKSPQVERPDSRTRSKSKLWLSQLGGQWHLACHLHERTRCSQSSMWHWTHCRSLDFSMDSSAPSAQRSSLQDVQENLRTFVGKTELKDNFISVQKYLKSTHGLLVIGILCELSGRHLILFCSDASFIQWTCGPCHPSVTRMLLI